jgi:hypothetical protein
MKLVQVLSQKSFVCVELIFFRLKKFVKIMDSINFYNYSLLDLFQLLVFKIIIEYPPLLCLIINCQLNLST